MRNKAGMVLFAILGGFVGGFVLSEVIGIVGLLLFDRAIGFRYLPFILAAAGAVLGLLFVNRWTRRR